MTTSPKARAAEPAVVQAQRTLRYAAVEFANAKDRKTVEMGVLAIFCTGPPIERASASWLGKRPPPHPGMQYGIWNSRLKVKTALSPRRLADEALELLEAAAGD